MSEHYWMETDRWVLKEAIAEIVARKEKVVDIVVFQDEDIWVLVETCDD